VVLCPVFVLLDYPSIVDNQVLFNGLTVVRLFFFYIHLESPTSNLSWWRRIRNLL